MVAGSLVGMGLMQMVVSCTLSMLLRHTKRYAVLGKFQQHIKHTKMCVALNDMDINLKIQ